jgi:adenosine deaminase
MSTQISDDALRRAPKVLLHDHLDGGLRPATILELAAEAGHKLPADNVEDLAAWFHRGAQRNDLVLYLETFEHTTACMQTFDHIERVAYECVEDLANDGVVYAEVRMAPELCIDNGLTPDQAVEAMLAGFKRGMANHDIEVGLIVTAMRHAARSQEIAEVALRHLDEGVVGFDIAGSESGNPPSRHLDAFRTIAQANSHITIHAGEAFGLPSIWEALQICGAERLGHGVRIIDDITIDDDGQAQLGPLASFVRDRRVPLEMCPTSNVNTGVCATVADHPIGLLRALRFRVTVNTDNRLMSDISMTREFAKLRDAFGWGWDDFEWLTINAMKSSFWPFDKRLRIINERIKPGYAALKASSLGSNLGIARAALR